MIFWFYEIDAEDERAIAEARKRILAARPGPRVAAAMAAENRLFDCLRQAVIAWADDSKPDIRVVAAEIARIRAFRAMLRGLPPPRRGRKGSNAGEGVARGRRGSRRRSGRG